MKSPVRLFTALLIAATLPLLAVGCDVVVDSDSCGLDEDFACGNGTEVPAGWVCDDEVDCTADLCQPEGATDQSDGCVHEPDEAACDDADACTVDTCDPAEGCILTLADCDDDLDCTEDLCEPGTGTCTHSPNDALCDDQHPCSVDRCDATAGCEHLWSLTLANCSCCVPHAGPGCGDPEVQAKVCQSEEKCCEAGQDWNQNCAKRAANSNITGDCNDWLNLPNTCVGACGRRDCSDGLCNYYEADFGCFVASGTLMDPSPDCGDGVDCEISSDCDDGSVCTHDVCEPDLDSGTRCIHVGAALAGQDPAVVCDDGDPCTIDSCVPGSAGEDDSAVPDCDHEPDDPSLCQD